MSDALAEIREGLGEIGSVQRECLDRLKAQEEAAKGFESAVTALEEKHGKIEDWLETVEEKANKARFGSPTGGGSDALLAVIPERHRIKVQMFQKFPGSRAIYKDPVKSAALATWLQCAWKLQIGRFAREHAECAETMSKIQQALGDVPELRAAAMQEDTNTEGGFAVPSPLEGEVLRAIADEAVVRPMVRIVPMTSKTLDWPGGDNAVTAAIIAEEGTITESNETFTQKQLVAKKFAAIGTASMELLADSAINILDYYLTLASEQIALLEDDEALEGDGTNFTGINSASGTNSVAAGGTNATLSDEIGKVVFAGGQRSRRNAAWVASSQTLGHLAGVSDSNGKPLLNTMDVGRILELMGSGDSSPDGTILSRPAYSSDQITVTAGIPDTANVYFGNFRGGLIYGDRTGIDFAISEHTKFTTAQVQMRVIKRTAILVGVPAYFTKWTGVPSK